MKLTPPTLPDLKSIGTSKVNELKYLFTRNIDKLTSINYASQIQIKEKLSIDNLIEEEPNKYGRRFICDLEITGVNGRTATVRTAWIKDNGKFFLRLTSLYIK